MSQEEVANLQKILKTLSEEVSAQVKENKDSNDLETFFFSPISCSEETSWHTIIWRSFCLMKPFSGKIATLLVKGAHTTQGFLS